MLWKINTFLYSCTSNESGLSLCIKNYVIVVEYLKKASWFFFNNLWFRKFRLGKLDGVTGQFVAIQFVAFNSLHYISSRGQFVARSIRRVTIYVSQKRKRKRKRNILIKVLFVRDSWYLTKRIRNNYKKESIIFIMKY